MTGYPTSPPGPASIFSVELIAAPHGTPLPNPLGTYVPRDMLLYFIPDYSSLSGFLAANPGWVPVATTGSTVFGGLFNGGEQTIASVAPGANADYIVIGWKGPYASFDVAFAANAFMGESALLTTATGNPTLTPPSTPVNLNTTFTGITLAPIPEPTTFALAGLGLVALLVFRWRR